MRPNGAVIRALPVGRVIIMEGDRGRLVAALGPVSTPRGELALQVRREANVLAPLQPAAQRAGTVPQPPRPRRVAHAALRFNGRRAASQTHGKQQAMGHIRGYNCECGDWGAARCR